MSRNRIAWVGACFAVWAVVHYVGAAELSEQDLSKYENGGVYEVRALDDEGTEQQRLAELRQFLWQHYKEGKLGFVEVVFVSIEGGTNRFSFFIDEDATGRVGISVRGRKSEPRLQNDGQDNPVVETADRYTVVERFESRGKGNKLGSRLSDDIVLNALQYRLKLWDPLTGKEVVW